MSYMPRSWLFVPGTRPDRFGKALASGAGAVILDLEDAVSEADKASARAAVLEVLGGYPAGVALAVRINALDRSVGLSDLAALAEAGARPDFVVLPKVEHAETVRLAAAVLGEAGPAPGIIALIETAAGVAQVDHISAARGLSGLMFGAADYSADLGVIAGAHPHLHARAALANAAAAAGVLAVDSPAFDLDDLQALEVEGRAARGLGFLAKAAIHPRHVPAIEALFAWSEADVVRARRILEALNGVGTLDGRMIDAAMARWARRVSGA